MPEICEVDEVEELEAILNALETVTSLDEVRRLSGAACLVSHS